MKAKITLVAASLALIALGVPAARSSADHVRVSPSGHPYSASGAVAPQPGTVYGAPAGTTSGTVYTAPAGSGSVTVVPGSAGAVVHPGPGTIVVPSTGTVIVSPSGTMAAASALPTTLHAEQILAHQVRAHTIYANRIEADQVKGVLHHTGKVNVDTATTTREVVGNDVAASVIYADAIAANNVVAEHIYAREVEMSPARFSIAPLGGRVVRRQSP